MEDFPRLSRPKPTPRNTAARPVARRAEHNSYTTSSSHCAGSKSWSHRIRRRAMRSAPGWRPRWPAASSPLEVQPCSRSLNESTRGFSDWRYPILQTPEELPHGSCIRRRVVRPTVDTRTGNTVRLRAGGQLPRKIIILLCSRLSGFTRPNNW